MKHIKPIPVVLFALLIIVLACPSVQSCAVSKKSSVKTSDSDSAHIPASIEFTPSEITMDVSTPVYAVLKSKDGTEIGRASITDEDALEKLNLKVTVKRYSGTTQKNGGFLLSRTSSRLKVSAVWTSDSVEDGKTKTVKSRKITIKSVPGNWNYELAVTEYPGLSAFASGTDTPAVIAIDSAAGSFTVLRITDQNGVSAPDSVYAKFKLQSSDETVIKRPGSFTKYGEVYVSRLSPVSEGSTVLSLTAKYYGTVATLDTEVRAKTARTFTIARPDGGETSYSLDSGDNLNRYLVKIPKKDQSTLKLHFSNTATGESVDALSEMPGFPLTVKVEYELIPFTVSFRTAGGQLLCSEKVKPGDTIPLPPSIEGTVAADEFAVGAEYMKTFLNWEWYTEDGVLLSEQTIMPSRNLVAVAKHRSTIHTLTFELISSGTRTEYTFLIQEGAEIPYEKNAELRDYETGLFSIYEVMKMADSEWIWNAEACPKLMPDYNLRVHASSSRSEGH